MTPFPIPLVALGAGSQPDDGVLDYLPMPQGMSVFHRPGLEDPGDARIREALIGVLERVVRAIQAYRDGVPHPVVDLTGVDRATVSALNDALGHGEVSVLSNRPHVLRIQETAFAGVWRVLVMDGAGAAIRESIEIGAMPPDVVSSARAAGPRTEPLAAPADVMNAPAVLEELRNASVRYRQGDPAHVVNLSLLPVTPGDLDHLVTALGQGTTAILSRGYGNCRISSTALSDVWWVQYFNSTEQLILNTIEVTAVPEVALAAAEDVADSAARLAEFLDELRSA